MSAQALMCGWCAQAFMPRHRLQYLCSTECRKAFDRQKKREWRRDHPLELKARNHQSYLKHKTERNRNSREDYYTHREHYLELRREWTRNHAEQTRRQQRDHYQANRPRLLEQKKLYALVNPEIMKERKHRSYMKNRETIRIYRQAYLLKNKPAIRAKIREWERSHPLMVRGYRQRRRALTKGSVQNDLTSRQLAALFRVSGQRCAYCGELVVRLTLDHITPLASGGMHTLQNVVMACKSCNSRKRTNGPLSPVQPWLLIV